MDAVIKKWGNSPAVRLNASAMKIAAFDVEQRVTIKASKGRIVIEPADKFELKLEALGLASPVITFLAKSILAALSARKHFSGKPGLCA